MNNIYLSFDRAVLHMCVISIVKEQEETKGRNYTVQVEWEWRENLLKKALFSWFSVPSCVSQTLFSHTESLRGVTLHEERRQLLK